MSWNAAKASTWLKRYADDLADDASRDNQDWMWACAGAAYYCVIHGVGYNTQQEFEQTLRNWVKVDEHFIQDAVEEITT